MCEFGISEVLEEDLPGLVALEEACFPDPWSLEALAYPILEAEDPVKVVAIKATGGGGSFLGSPGSLKENPDLFGSSGPHVMAYALFVGVEAEWELLRLATHPSVRRQGLGRRLLQAGLDRLTLLDGETCYLEVRRGNTAARSLYEEIGFEVVGERPRYYPGGEDAILMTWRGKYL